MAFLTKLIFWTIVAPIALSVAAYYAIVYFENCECNRIVPVIEAEGWWAVSDRAKTPISTDIKPLVINVSNAQLEDLKLRLQRANFIPNIVSDHTYGFRGDQLKEIRDYWAGKYDWRKWEREINSMKHYTTQIEGINVHYAVVKPSEAAAGASASSSGETITLVLLHGWPSSFFEFAKLAKLLAKPDSTNSYPGSNLQFEVIIPSLPGYGWGEGAHRPGLNPVAISRIFLKLLARLGRRSYYVHGGDWGSIVSQTMARLVADKVFLPDYDQSSKIPTGANADLIIKGVHTNFAPIPAGKKSFWCKVFLAWLFPSFIDPQEHADFFPLSKQLGHFWDAFGYAHIQATRPDSVAAALADSPIGLAAYLLEKYSAWTHRENPQRADGGLTEKYSLDELLTNVMVYWLSDSIGTSVRLYKEMLGNTASDVRQWLGQPLRGLPIGVAAFPHEVVPVVKWFVQGAFPEMIHYAKMPSGGHFPALEEPELLSKSIREFVHAAESYWQEKSKTASN